MLINGNFFLALTAVIFIGGGLYLLTLNGLDKPQAFTPSCSVLAQYAPLASQQTFLAECEKYYRISCTTDSECGPFSCLNKGCLIQVCSSDSDCTKGICGRSGSAVEGFCTLNESG